MQPKPPVCRDCEQEVLLSHSGSGHPKRGAPGSLETILAACCCFLALSGAAAPTNDICSGAETIPANAGASSPYYTSIKDITLATTNGDPRPGCHDFVARGIWYVFTPNSNAIFSISACNDPMGPTATTVHDTVMSIYQSSTGCAGPFTFLECSDDSCGPELLQSSITRLLFANVHYYILVWQYADAGPPPTAGLVQLRITRAIRPVNDTCATATPVPLNFPVAGTTVGADDSYELPAGSTCFTGPGQVPSTAAGRDVVFSFTAPRADYYNFKVYNYSIQGNLVLYVADSCPMTGTPAVVTNCLGAANRSSASSAEEVVCVPLAANQRVFIFVDEHTLATGSSFTLEVTPCWREREPNNDWTSASFLACGLTGGIQPGGDVDFYHLGSPPAGSRAFVLINGDAANTTDFDLRITTDTDTLEYDDQDNDLPFGSFSPNIAGAILPGGPVYARVDFRSASSSEPYLVYAVIQPPMSAAAPEIEPNNTVAEATSDSVQYYRGELAGPAPSTDVDTFMFTADASELVFVSLDEDPLRDDTPMNAKLELLDESGNVLVTVDDDNSFSSTNSIAGSLTAVTPQSPGEAFIYRVANDGTYFVRVSISPGTEGLAGAGDYLLSISRNCYNGTAGFANSPVVLDEVTVSPAFEGDVSWLSGTLHDADSWQPHSMMVDWGDGSSVTNYLLGGVVDFSLRHTYLDDNPTGTPFDAYPVRITVNDYSGSSIVSNINAVVSNASPVITAVTITSPINSSETATLQGTFSDAGVVDTFQLIVNWGDGSAEQTADYPEGASSFNLTHPYVNAGSNHVVVTLRDDDGDAATQNLTVVVQPRIGIAATFEPLTIGPVGVVLRLQGTPNAQYHVEYSTDLTTWIAFPPVNADGNGLIQFRDDTAPMPAQRFYRAVSP
jgi:hypothetical protein